MPASSRHHTSSQPDTPKTLTIEQHVENALSAEESVKRKLIALKEMQPKSKNRQWNHARNYTFRKTLEVVGGESEAASPAKVRTPEAYSASLATTGMRGETAQV